MRDQPPTQKTFHRLSGLGVPPVDKLRFVWPSLLIHRGRSGGTAIQNKWTRIRSSRPYVALVNIRRPYPNRKILDVLPSYGRWAGIGRNIRGVIVVVFVS
jgi:hypothetical protein